MGQHAGDGDAGNRVPTISGQGRCNRKNWAEFVAGRETRFAPLTKLTGMLTGSQTIGGFKLAVDSNTKPLGASGHEISTPDGLH
jgi:hypothetical protein